MGIKCNIGTNRHENFGCNKNSNDKGLYQSFRHTSKTQCEESERRNEKTPQRIQSEMDALTHMHSRTMHDAHILLWQTEAKEAFNMLNAHNTRHTEHFGFARALLFYSVCFVVVVFFGKIE